MQRDTTVREVDEREWALAQIIQNPVMFREFINEDDSSWKPLEEHERAWTACKAKKLAMCCGRSVHKTTTLIEMLYYWVISKDFIAGDQPNLFCMVPNKSQKDLTFGRIVSACRQHWLMSRLVRSINMSEGRIDFINGFQLLFRIAGEKGSEDNVIGVHTTKIWVDEAQEFPWKTWLSLQNCLKFEIPNHKLVVSGVPNGERKDNVLYYCDQLDETFISFNIPQTLMSWWTPEIEYARRREYGALQEDSEDYKHFVLGMHGVPQYSVFDRVRFRKEEYEVHRYVLTQTMFDESKRADRDGVIRFHINEVLPLPPLPIKNSIKPKVGCGYDPGYSPDPAVFFVMYEDEHGFWKNMLRIVLQRVEYGLQREVLAWLDRVYQFDFIGMDMGGVGKVQWQDLAGELSEYNETHNFKERLFPVDFGASMVVALKTEKNEVIEKKDQIKRVAVETTSRWTQESHRFVFSTLDDNLMAELERTKFSRTNTGEPVYKTADDHQFSAMMCAIMSYEHSFGPALFIPKPEIKPKLFRARWIDTSIGAYRGVSHWNN